MKKKLLAGLLGAVLVVSLFTGCGNGGSSDTDSTSKKEETSSSEEKEEKKEEKVVAKSMNEAIEVTVPDGWVATPSENYEKIALHKDGDDEKDVNTGIFIGGPLEDGDFWDFKFQNSSGSYVEGEPYTYDQIKTDYEAYIVGMPNVYSNPEEVTIGDYTYYSADVARVDKSKIYWTVVNDKPVQIEVVSGGYVDDPDVEGILESVVFNY